MVVGSMLLTSCSVLIPERMWHPPGWLAEEGHLGCPSYGYPVADLAFGVPMLTLGAVGAVTVTEPSHGINDVVLQGAARAAMVVGLGAGTLWTASAIYGFWRNARCHRELSSDRGRATPALPPLAARLP
jgi:hypothetical protein